MNNFSLPFFFKYSTQSIPISHLLSICGLEKVESGKPTRIWHALQGRLPITGAQLHFLSELYNTFSALPSLYLFCSL